MQDTLVVVETLRKSSLLAFEGDCISLQDAQFVALAEAEVLFVFVLEGSTLTVICRRNLVLLFIVDC